MTIIHSISTSPSFNLAAEEYFFTLRQQDILFLYVNSPSVILGCNQLLEAEVNVEYCSNRNIPVYKRISGGGAVFHDLGNLNYAFITNREIGKYPLEGAFLEPVIQALSKLNVPTLVGKRKDLWLPGGHKISGTASHVSKTRELHHGTLLYAADVDALKKALNPHTTLQLPKKHIASVRSEVKNIQTYLTEQNLDAPSMSVFFQQLKEELSAHYGNDLILEELSINNEWVTALEHKYLPLS